MRRAVQVGVMVLGGLMAIAPPAFGAPRAFEKRFSTNDTGNIAMVANTLMTCPASEAGCTAAQGGSGSGTALNNNAYTMQYVNADPAPGVFNSSRTTLSLPAGATVLKAMLYYGADSTAGAGGAPPPNASARTTVLWKAPGDAGYTTLTALEVDDTTTDGNDFQGIVDVTDLVGAAGSGSYSVANVQAGTGRDRQAGWSLVVAYRDTSQPPRNLTIFDGFQVVNSRAPSISIPVSGFQTPPSGPVRTELGFVAYEGDAGSTGDSAKLNSTTLSDATNPANNFFNSAISHDGAAFTNKDPNFVNQLGFDAILVGADGILANNDTSAVIRLTTGGETYFPGAVTFATELFAPNVQLVKSVTDDNGGNVEPGDTLTYTINATNTGGDDATNVVISDLMPSHTTFVPGSLRIDDAVTANAAFLADQNKAVFNVGAGATPDHGGTLPGPNGATRVSFQVTVGSAPPDTEIANTAHADFFSKTLTVPLTADSNTVTSTLAAPDLTVAKLPPTFIAVSGVTQTFTLRVTNNGTASSSGTVTVTDPFEAAPPGAFDSINAVTAPGWSCNLTPPAATPATLLCTRSDALAPGDAYPDITVTAHVAGLPNDHILNTATVAGGGDGDTTNNSSTSTGQTTTRADVQLLKTAEPTTALTGQQVRFTLRVRNGGPSTAANVQVTDADIGTNYSVDSVSSSQGGCTALPCALGTLDAGGEATVTVIATVTVTGAGVVSADNTATVTSATTDPDPSNDDSTATVDVPPTADMSVTKTASPDPLDTTAPASYTLTFHNAGPQDAAGATLTDQLPSGFTFTSATPSQGSCAPPGADGAIFCALGTVASGATGTVTVNGTLAGSAAGTFVSNSAHVSSDTGDPDPVNNGATNTTLAIPAADVELAKFADNPTPNTGDQVTFTLLVTNHGPSVALNTQVTDTLPAGLTLISAPGCSQSGATLTCAVGSLVAGASQSFPVTVRVDAAGGQDVTNSATATSDTPDPIAPNGTDSATISVGQPAAPPTSQPQPAPLSPPNAADLVVTKRPLGRAVVGEQLRYAITVANRGPATATGATVADNLSRHLRLVSARPSQGRCTGSREIRCTLGDLGAGAQATITLTVTPRDMGAVNNTARVSSATPDPNGANNVGRARVNVGPATSLGVRKTADRRSVRAGNTVGYRITVRTSGRRTARDVRVCDRPPAGLAFVKTAGAKLRDGQACWTIRSLRRGKSRTFAVTARATGRSSPRTLTNRVRVSAANARSRSGRAAVRVLPNEVRPGGVTG